ncbi:unnamed protein product [Schistosoma turkestanicum]|nr:unnamed protein product [Schistosoma turkestanicum]
MNHHFMAATLFILFIVNFCWFIPVKSQFSPTFQMSDSEDEYPETTGRYSPSMHRGHPTYFNYKDRFRWSKRVPPYITGGIRYR